VCCPKVAFKMESEVVDNNQKGSTWTWFEARAAAGSRLGSNATTTYIEFLVQSTITSLSSNLGFHSATSMALTMDS
jgi:hypothetical protein